MQTLLKIPMRKIGDGIKVPSYWINRNRQRTRPRGKKVAGRKKELQWGVFKNKTVWMSNSFYVLSMSKTCKAWRFWRNSQLIWWFSRSLSVIIRALQLITGHQRGAQLTSKFWTMRQSWGCRRCRTLKPIWTGYRVSLNRKSKWSPGWRVSWRKPTRGFRA